MLDGIDLDVAGGEVVVLLGPGGSGKSTLLGMVNHLESVDWGDIAVCGRRVGYHEIPGGIVPAANLAKARADARIGMVFQHFNLFNHMTALENIMEAPVQVFGFGRAEAEARARGLLAMVGLQDHADHLPYRPSPAPLRSSRG
ncbi:ATP-binding cassette domain-containing protein [Pseudogemmobacter sonorensis]|uniref:ATP-binding cassette domain-containing protein n=1 Tax=Pseudogemmobacter sonorensis TaxID=2989681 RepID=UPI003F67D466